MEEGKKIYVESVMSDEEWREYGKKFRQSTEKIPYFKSEFDWRRGMGAPLIAAEIGRINTRLEILKKQVL